MKNALNNPAGNYMFQVCQWCCSCTFIVNFEIFHSSSVSIVNFEHVIAGWEAICTESNNPKKSEKFCFG